MNYLLEFGAKVVWTDPAGFIQRFESFLTVLSVWKHPRLLLEEKLSAQLTDEVLPPKAALTALRIRRRLLIAATACRTPHQSWDRLWGGPMTASPQGEAF